MESGSGKSRTASVRTADKSKRDEWSEGGVSSLLDVYESKWLLRNRSKLKGTDWEEIAQKVSVRDGGAKPGKTPNQCKNKIESMKKRYRAESSLHNHSSTWQYYTRIDGLVKGTDHPRPAAPTVDCNIVSRSGVAELESLNVPGSGLERVGDNGATPPPVMMEKTPNYEPTVEEGRSGHCREEPLNLNISSTFQVPLMGKTQNCEATDGRRVHNQEETNLLIGNGAAQQAPSMEKARNCETNVVQGRRGQNQEEANLDDGSSTIPDNGGCCSLSKVVAKMGDGSGEINPFKRRKKAGTGSAVADSIRLLAHSVLKIEKSRMEMYKDSERLRAEAEVRRAELDLKRTEIIAKTQLQIAKIFVRTQFGQCNGSGSSSSDAEPVVTPETEDKNG